MLSDAINVVGDWGPIIMICLAIWVLYVAGNKTYVYYFIVGIVINTISNLVLKGAIQQPRPADMNNPGVFHKRVRNILATRHGMPFNLFGMPSGHAQAVMYILTFLWATVWRWGGGRGDISQRWVIKGVLLLVGLIVLVQRVEWQHHTVFQVVVGAVIGAAIGWGAYWMGSGKLQSGGAGGLSKRADDGAVWSHRVHAGFL